MKVGFWTGGMPKWSHAELAKRASELGYDGIALSGSYLDPLGLKMTDEELEEIKRTYAQAGVEVDMLISRLTGHSNFDSDKVDWNLLRAELATVAKVAARLGIPRIMPNATLMIPVPGVKWDWPQYLDDLARTSLEAIKETPGVNVVFENHNGSASAQQLLEMVERAGNNRLGVVLSPDHCIVMQENPVELADRYWSGIQHVCLGDRRPVEEDLGTFDGRYYYVRYEACVIGEGITPVAEILSTLDSHGYNGYAALKWEKSDEPRTWPLLPRGYGWHLPAGEAVLPGYIEFVRSLDVMRSKA